MDPRIAYGEGREALLRAAITVTAREGLRGLTYRAVAAEAGVTHGLVRYHFKTRENLIEEALRHAVGRSIAESDVTPDVPLTDLLAALAPMVAADPDAQAFQFELTLESRRREGLADEIDLMYETYRQTVATVLRANGVVSAYLPQLVHACIDGLVLRQIAGGSASETESVLAELRELLRLHAQAHGSDSGDDD